MTTSDQTHKRKVTEEGENDNQTVERQDEIHKMKKAKTCDHNNSEETRSTICLHDSLDLSLVHSLSKRVERPESIEHIQETNGSREITENTPVQDTSSRTSLEAEQRVPDSCAELGQTSKMSSNPAQANPGKLNCILRCNLQVKQNGGLIKLEAFYQSGSAGKDGLNQILQFMRNQLTNPTL